MAFHTVIGSASGAAAAASWGLFAAAGAAPHDPTTVLLLIPAIISSFAAVIGTFIAIASFLRHRGDGDELERQNERIDRIERILMHDDGQAGIDSNQ